MLSTGTAFFFALSMAAAAPRAAIVALGSDRELSPAERAEVEAVLNVRGYQGIDEVEAVALRDEAASQPAPEAAQVLYIEAKKALMNFDDQTARQKLERARLLLFESPRILTERILLADTHLLGGLMALASGQPEQAERDFTLAALLEPSRTLHPGLFPPDVVQAFEAAKARLAAQPRGALVVDTRPPASVYVDGNFRGQAPLVVERLAAGPHYVTAAVPGRGARTRVVDVVSGHSTPLVLFVPDAAGEPLPELLAAYRTAPEQPGVAGRLLERVGADLVIAIGTSSSAAALDDVEGEPLCAVHTREPQEGEDLGALALQLLDAVEEARRARHPPSIAASMPASLPAVVTASAPATLGQGAVAEEEPTSAWVWAAVGAGGVAVATAAVVTAVVVVANWPEPPEPEERARIVWW